ncbi:hypothetical protein RND81_04G193200 [Saponaria officinalis]|uniref:Uncharacterized protein n=1 Tax=Saponaria officinalis TaxID=3572 RepID=A0AAW1LFJ1_SAPOF
MKIVYFILTLLAINALFVCARDIPVRSLRSGPYPIPLPPQRNVPKDPPMRSLKSGPYPIPPPPQRNVPKGPPLQELSLPPLHVRLISSPPPPPSYY